MRKYWRIAALISLIFLLVGCASREQSVRTYDEAADEQLKERYIELDQMFFEQYDSAAEMIRDPLYEEYRGLHRRFGPGSSHTFYADDLKNNLSATVDLDNQIIKREGVEIPYRVEGSEVIIPNNNTELRDETLIRFVKLAEQKYDDTVGQNRHTLITGGWLPILILLSGLIGFMKPERVWYLEGGFRNKDAEPSQSAMTWMKVRSFIAFGLAGILFWMLYRSLI